MNENAVKIICSFCREASRTQGADEASSPLDVDEKNCVPFCMTLLFIILLYILKVCSPPWFTDNIL
jgi:hypothetical protein